MRHAHPSTLHDWETHVTLAPEELAATWAEYHRTRGEHARNLLIEHYLPLVKYNADRIHSRLPGEVDLDDVIAAGIDGLRAALESFDPDRGFLFQTYCTPRIRGAILDALRHCDRVTRLMRTRAVQLSRTRRLLHAQLGRAPSDEEIAERLSLSRTQYVRLVRDAQAADIVSLNQATCDSDMGRDCARGDTLFDTRAEPPMKRSQREDIKRLITRGLSQVERTVVILYYYEEMTMKEIGATLGTSESRVSQIHAGIVARLQDAFQGRRDEFTMSS
jgi:RNA polymerase sigma factor for flagellar operon FliA